MIPLHYQHDKDREWMYLKEIEKGRRKSYLKDIDDKCKEYLGLNFEEIVLLPPDKLMEKKQQYDMNPEEKKAWITKEFRSILKADNRYIENTLYGDMPSSARKIVFDTAKVRTCPYCNRNFIQMVDTEEKAGEREFKSFFELDHFLDKGTYPMFAVSLYNLIPVCPSCNRIKSTQKFDYYPYHFANRSDDLIFHYMIKGVDFLIYKK